MSESVERREEGPRSMNRPETIAFLEERGVRPLEDFSPHTPLLYVHEDAYRGNDGPFKHLPRDKRPSIARIHDPVSLSNPKGGPERIVHDLANEGGRVEHYAIDPKTKQLTLVMTEEKTKKYQVLRRGLFEAPEELFT